MGICFFQLYLKASILLEIFFNVMLFNLYDIPLFSKEDQSITIDKLIHSGSKPIIIACPSLIGV